RVVTGQSDIVQRRKIPSLEAGLQVSGATHAGAAQHDRSASLCDVLADAQTCLEEYGGSAFEVRSPKNIAFQHYEVGHCGLHSAEDRRLATAARPRNDRKCGADERVMVATIGTDGVGLRFVDDLVYAIGAAGIAYVEHVHTLTSSP